MDKGEYRYGVTRQLCDECPNRRADPQVVGGTVNVADVFGIMHPVVVLDGGLCGDLDKSIIGKRVRVTLEDKR
jgi:hypothetical protein